MGDFSEFQNADDESETEPAGLRSFAAHLFAPININRAQLFDLLVPIHHITHIRRHSAAVIISRIQLAAALFAVLVPLCAIFDWMVFPSPQNWEMTAIRLASAAIFICLAWPWRLSQSRLQADIMLFTLLAVPPIFYLLSIEITQGVPLDDFGTLVTRLYPLMPNIVLAGLAVFPLTAIEVMMFSVPAFICAIAGIRMSGEVLSMQQHGPMLWLMVLVMGVAMFSGMSQLHYIATLVNRAMIDPLTGAYTRRSGGETLELLFRLSAMQGTPMTVAFFDIDRFKSINDVYGHDEGDRALRSLAEHLRLGLRVGDTLVRWGGEEFVAILNNTDIDGARIVIERLRRTGFGLRPDGQPMTASIGVAERRRDGTQDWPQLLEIADKRMYEAKNTGRNRVVLPNGEVLS